MIDNNCINKPLNVNGQYLWLMREIENRRRRSRSELVLPLGFVTKGLGVMMTTGGDDVIRFLRGACQHVTSVGVVSPRMLMILVIGLLDCVGDSS